MRGEKDGAPSLPATSAPKQLDPEQGIETPAGKSTRFSVRRSVHTPDRYVTASGELKSIGNGSIDRVLQALANGERVFAVYADEVFEVHGDRP